MGAHVAFRSEGAHSRPSPSCIMTPPPRFFYKWNVSSEPNFKRHLLSGRSVDHLFEPMKAQGPLDCCFHGVDIGKDGVCSQACAVCRKRGAPPGFAAALLRHRPGMGKITAPTGPGARSSSPRCCLRNARRATRRS
jgi:hypothetical protein